MSRIRTASIGSAIVILASLALARVHPFGDPGLYRIDDPEPLLSQQSGVPHEVRAILIEKCADCHSGETHPPLYGRFAPASWLMERDIAAAREAMNLSRWNAYSAAQQQTLAAKMVQEMKSHDMPPRQYSVIHRNARTTDADLLALTRWTNGLQASEAVDGSASSGDGNPARGREVFEKRCTGCHALAQNREGPMLQGVYGRTSGSVSGFDYSPALKKARIVWNKDSLEQWLADPDAFVPGNNMDFRVSKPQERDLISFLEQAQAKIIHLIQKNKTS